MISEFSDKIGISAGLIFARLTSCQFCLTFIRVELIQPERHHCEEFLIKKQAKSIADLIDLCLPFDGPWSWFNCNVNVCMYCFCSRSSQFFNCSCSKSSQVILFTSSRLKSILSHFSSSTSHFLTNKVTPRSGFYPRSPMEACAPPHWFRAGYTVLLLTLQFIGSSRYQTIKQYSHSSCMSPTVSAA